MKRSSARSRVTLGLVQTACTADPAANLKSTLAAVARAARAGAQIICTQELFRSQYFCQSEDPANFALAETIPGPSTQALIPNSTSSPSTSSPLLIGRRTPMLFPPYRVQFLPIMAAPLTTSPKVECHT